MTDEELKNLAYLAASICGCYGCVTKRQAEHMTVESFKKYPKKFFIDTMKIGMEIHGFGNKVDEFEEKMNDPRFDVLFNEDAKWDVPPEEEVVSEGEVPTDAVIEKEVEDGRDTSES